MNQRLVLNSLGQFSLEESAIEQVDGEILVRIVAAGVCGSDIPRAFIKGPYHYPLVLGHEFAGVIHEVPPGSHEFTVGQPCVVFPLLWCDACPSCAAGRYALCSNYDYYGSRRDGAFQQFLSVKPRNILVVPDRRKLEDYALVEPAAVALHAYRKAKPRIGERIAVFGAGPIGLLIALWALRDQHQVTVYDFDSFRLRLAANLSQRLIALHSETIDDQASFDVVFEAAGVPVTLRTALGICAPDSKVIIVGNPSNDVTLSASEISRTMRRELTIIGTWNSNYSLNDREDDWRKTVKAIAEDSLPVARLITERVRLEEGAQTMKTMFDGSLKCCKVLLVPNGE